MIYEFFDCRKNFISTRNMRYGEFTYELFSIIMEVSNEKTKEEISP